MVTNMKDWVVDSGATKHIYGNKSAFTSYTTLRNERNKYSWVILDLLWIPKNTMSKGGKRFYITFIDDYSRYTRVYLLRNKDEARDIFIQYKNKVENRLSKKIKVLELIGKESMSPTPLILLLKIMGSFTKLLLLIPLI
ncbi:hypothetical protein CK203_100388 [Vitis vinifera]|uniref:Retrovirus-related Pol polyprotein from transposon TNT 1-94 n=1 Tax=Vitis vinifera TaxID=29760 RepID=A0A438DL93_VITVI|nr:hypothetical protein CK203_100388 [Vitis vinifera]